MTNEQFAIQLIQIRERLVIAINEVYDAIPEELLVEEKNLLGSTYKVYPPLAHLNELRADLDEQIKILTDMDRRIKGF